MMVSELKEKYDEWMKWDQNPVTRKEIEGLRDNHKELSSRLLKRMAFGTAGLRARMGAGYSQMNDLTILQTSQGLLATCMKYDSSKGIAIGYDARYNSKNWAKIIAKVFHSAGLKVYLFSETVPTPFLAFAVRQLKTLCGVMVTASHNPKDDNGYKVYWDNGSQIISPLDKEIAGDILKNLEPKSEHWQYQDIDKFVKDPLSDIESVYYDMQYSKLSSQPDKATMKKLSVVYTAMHGVGYPYLKKILNRFGVESIVSVSEQQQHDPEFTTVKFPNPEEKGALDLAIATATKHRIPVLIANDPDADRFTAGELQASTGKYRLFTGNELGALFGWWMWQIYSTKPHINKSDIYMLSSTVSSKILRSISEVEGFNFIDTLTGFKWMGNLADELAGQNKSVIFAFEEAIGFMCGPVVLDKDGISAAAVFAEMAAHIYHAKNMTLADQLTEIYSKYGHHICNNGYLRSTDPQATADMFNQLRHYNNNKPGTYPSHCESHKVTHIRDLTTGFYSYPEQYKLPSDPSNQMITFTFSNNCSVTIRASGTEPKIKFYSEIIVKDSNKSLNDVQQELEQLIHHIKQQFYQQNKFGFTE